MTENNSNFWAAAPSRHPLRLAGRAIFTMLALTLALGTASVPTAGASQVQETPTTEPAAQPGSSTTIELSSEKETESLGSSLPEINAGHKPVYSGDRGTWPQYALMAGMVLVLTAFVLLFRRDMRKARAVKSASAGPAGQQS